MPLTLPCSQPPTSSPKRQPLVPMSSLRYSAHPSTYVYTPLPFHLNTDHSIFSSSRPGLLASGQDEPQGILASAETAYRMLARHLGMISRKKECIKSHLV